jgi:hypothetical protein
LSRPDLTKLARHAAFVDAVFFDVVHRTYLPRLIGRDRLIEGNARLQGNVSVAAAAAPTLAGYLAQAIYTAIIVVFLVRVVHLAPATIGLLNTVGLAGAVVAAMASRRLTAALGQARLMWLTVLLNAAGFLVLPLTGPGARLALFAAGGFVTGFGIIVPNVVQTGFQQAHCPAHLLGLAERHDGVPHVGRDLPRQRLGRPGGPAGDAVDRRGDRGAVGTVARPVPAPAHAGSARPA